jgi:nitric oxide reductase NorD protein
MSRRWPRTDAPQALDDVRTRLQRYVCAMYGRPIAIESLAPPKKTALHMRALERIALAKKQASSESDDHAIHLPATLLPDRTGVPAIERYRLLAVQHAERILRGSGAHAAQATSDLERDLYQLAESAAVDERIRTSQPGLGAVLTDARAAALARRPAPRWRTDVELHVESMVRAMGGDAGAGALPTDGDAQATADWARRTAVALEARFGRKAAQAYRRVPEMTLWGTSVSVRPIDEPPAQDSAPDETDPLPKIKRASTRSSAHGPASSSSQSSAARSPTAAEGAGSPSSAAADQSGDRTGEADDEAGGLSDADSSGTAAPVSALAPAEIVYRYPEWDTYSNDFNALGTVVRMAPSIAGPAEWATAALREHMMLVHRTKQQFERLRSHRVRLRRQIQGDDLDLDACVQSMVERRMGRTPTDRLYTMARPGRRELAVTLLIDVSGSTRDVVHEAQRIIDVERIAALIATAAFDALGDDYSILAFSGRGASNVRVRSVKEFGEENVELVHRRIGALEPEGTTRLGAAVRHAAAQLAVHEAPHRLLLILSDGKPHDYDVYAEDYAVQDSRRAVIDARAQGIHPFCITVDRAEAPEYIADIFGASGYLMVRQPAELPRALLGVVQRMLA